MIRILIFISRLTYVWIILIINLIDVELPLSDEIPIVKFLVILKSKPNEKSCLASL